jgi:alkylation response protein AidB-like acyl-CoA dehydrogenase
MVVLEIILLFVLVFGIIYMQAPVIVWTIAIGLGLLFVTISDRLNLSFLFISWLLYLLAVLFVSLKTLRLRYFSKPFIQFLQKRLPTMSDSERAAIEAGDIWWEKELFCGRPQWKKLLSIQPPKLTEEEHAFIENQVNTLCEMVNDWHIVNDEHDLPEEVWSYLKKEGFFGIVIPKEYGGHGFSAVAHSTIITKLATRSLSVAVNVMVPNSLGPGELLLHYGTPEQKKYYLPRLASGEEIPCFALTGPEAGSDAASITDTGIVCRDVFNGKEVLGLRLNWDKRYITLAPVATVVGVAFQLYDPDHLIGNKTDVGITLALIPRDLPGVFMGDRHIPLHLAFMNGPTVGQDVFIPIEWIIGGIARAGEGWHMLMESLSIGRSISLPALSTACGQLTYRMTGAYARLRKQFNTAIANFEGIEESLGYIAGFTYLLEATRVMTASAVDLKLRPAIPSAIAKYHMTEMSRKVIAHAMDIHAGHQIQVGPRNFLAHVHLAIPISITVEGANILTRNLIIFGQGAIRCHPYILKEMSLLSEPESKEKLLKLDRLLLSHIGFTISHLFRSFWCGLTGGYFIFHPVSSKVRRYYQQLTRMSTALALLSDICMLILGGSLKRKERTSARLGDILSQLYLASAVLKYYKDQGQPDSDLPYVQWSIEHCLFEIQVACDDLLHNFPIKWLGKVFRGIIFPWGVAYRKPNDNLTHTIVSMMIKPSVLRDRLTKYCFVSKNNNDSMRCIENALLQIEQVDPIWKKFQVALRHGTVANLGSLDERLQAALKKSVLTEEEIKTFYEYNQLYQEVIRVNAFTFDLRSIVT